MSILIKGVNMPQNETYLDLVITADGNVCCYDHEGVSVTKAVELPDHGDLIDRDVLRQVMRVSASCNRCERDAYKCEYYDGMTVMDVCEIIDDVPVVIPAERSEE